MSDPLAAAPSSLVHFVFLILVDDKNFRPQSDVRYLENEH